MSPVSVDSQVSIRITFFFAAEPIELASLGKITDDELQVLGLVQSFVVSGRLIATGDDVAGERGQQIFRA